MFHVWLGLDSGVPHAVGHGGLLHEPTQSTGQAGVAGHEYVGGVPVLGHEPPYWADVVIAHVWLGVDAGVPHAVGHGGLVHEPTQLTEHGSVAGHEYVGAVPVLGHEPPYSAGVVIAHVWLRVDAGVPHAVGHGGLSHEPSQLTEHGSVAGHVLSILNPS